MSTPDRLREARETAGLSQRQAAKAVDCSHVWLGDLETGRSALSAAWATKLAGLYDVDLNWLLTGTERPVDAETRAMLARLPADDRAAIEHLLGRLATKDAP